MNFETSCHGGRSRRWMIAAASALLMTGFLLTSLAEASVGPSLTKLPMSFEPNQGQTDSQVQFLSRGRGYTLFLTSTQAVLALQRPSPGKESGGADFNAKAARRSYGAKRRATHTPPSILRMGLVGANVQPPIESLDPLPGEANYFIGRDPARWRTGIQTFGRILYREVY